ncbi:MAG: hypothetical protein EP330_00355 [Deltaproteobacteria bacterium]|nr:MAG: hypothetical protein EP330_00355 [Deltaproteobacteria bacterium]
MAEEKLYGQHSAATLLFILAACTVVGTLIAVFAIPEDALPFGQRLGVGLFTGVWGAACLYGWRLIYVEGDEED